MFSERSISGLLTHPQFRCFMRKPSTCSMVVALRISKTWPTARKLRVQRRHRVSTSSQPRQRFIHNPCRHFGFVRVLEDIIGDEVNHFIQREPSTRGIKLCILWIPQTASSFPRMPASLHSKPKVQKDDGQNETAAALLSQIMWLLHMYLFPRSPRGLLLALDEDVNAKTSPIPFCRPPCGQRRLSIHSSSTRSLCLCSFVSLPSRLSYLSPSIFCFLVLSLFFCKPPFSSCLHSVRFSRACQWHRLNSASVCDVLGVILCLSLSHLFFL